MTQRLMALALVAVVAAAVPARAATVVTNCVEYIGPGGLAEALSEGGDIVFDCDGTIFVEPTGVVSIPTSLDAAGHAVTLSGGDRVRILNVIGTTLTLRGLSFESANGSAVGAENATLIVETCRFAGNSAVNRPAVPPAQIYPLPLAAAGGGAISAFGSAVTIRDSEFTDNVADDFWPRPVGGGGAVNVEGDTLVVENSDFIRNRTDAQPYQLSEGTGGAIRFVGASVVIRDSRFMENGASRAGGAVAVHSGALAVEDSEFEVNAATSMVQDAAGGAVWTSGDAVVLRSEFVGNSAGDGGAIDATGSLQIDQSEFTGNLAATLGFPDGEGGAVRSGGSSTVRASSFSRNEASNRGGAINGDGALAIETSTFDANRVRGLLPPPAGGGAVAGQDVSIVLSTFTRNDAGMVLETSPGFTTPGGAVLGGEVTVDRSTFSANRAAGDGGAVSAATLRATISTFNHNTALSDGGAIATVERATIVRSTLAFNVAGETGGALSAGVIDVQNSTVYGNTAGTAPQNAITGGQRGGGAVATGGGTIASTTIADNAGVGGLPAVDAGTDVTIVNSIIAGDPSVPNCRGPVVDGGHNIDSGSTCGFSTDNFSKPATDPRLRGLGDNGGPTRTVSLYADSPAIDAGDDALCPLRDQRNRPRVGVCDIGSFERQ